MIGRFSTNGCYRMISFSLYKHLTDQIAPFFSILCVTSIHLSQCGPHAKSSLIFIVLLSKFLNTHFLYLKTSSIVCLFLSISHHFQGSERESICFPPTFSRKSHSKTNSAPTTTTKYLTIIVLLR